MLRTTHIAICDNNRQDREFFAARCREFGERGGAPFLVKLYESSGELLFAMDNSAVRESIDILFLEADASGHDGIETALTLRRMGYGGQIIFLARGNPGDRIEAVFEARGSEYLLKRSAQRFESVFMRAAAAVRELHAEYVLYNRVGEYRQIAIADILYFDVQKNLVCVHYDNGYFEFLSTLAKVETQLSGRGFCRVHRLYVVSLDHVRRFTYSEAELSDGTKLPVGRTYYAAFRDALENWRRPQWREESSL